MTITDPPEKHIADPIEAFKAAQDAANLETADQGLLTLANLVESGAIDVSPQFQRRDRWGHDQQSALIESFLCNIPVPPVYLAEDAEILGSYAVIDGKQRLTSVAAFFSNALILRGLERLPQLNGMRYSDMPAQIRNPLGMKSLRTTTLLRQSHPDLKHEVFLRLNTGGEILNHQEIRNVAYRGPLNTLVYELAENEFLRKQFKVIAPTSEKYKQMQDAEYTLRFLTLTGSWKKFRGDLRGSMDDFMAKNRFSSGDHLETFKLSFNSCIATAEAIWGTHAFKRPGRDQAIAGLFDAQMLALYEVGQRSHAELIKKRSAVKKRSDSLFDERAFDEAVRLGTNTPGRLRARTDMMLSVMRSLIEG